MENATKQQISNRRWNDEDPLAVCVRFPEFNPPRFGDERWDLRCIEKRVNRSAPALSFDMFDGDRQLAAKELMAARLMKPIEPSRNGVITIGYKASTLNEKLVGLRKLYAFMDEQGIADFGALSQSQLNTFLRSLQQAGMEKLSQASTIGIFVWLWESRSFLSGGGLTFDPWNGRFMNEIVGYQKPDETVTERIPEAVMNGLTTWALAYVDHFSHDILQAAELLARSAIEAAEIEWEPGCRQKVIEYFKSLRYTKTRLPARRSSKGLKPAYKEIAAEIGVNRRVFYQGELRELLHEAADDLGLEELRPGTARYVPEGCKGPWRSPMTDWEIVEETGNLILAAYIVCAAFSGMRDSEVQALRSKCLKEVRDEQGAIFRYRLHGVTFKKKSKPIPQQWVVIEPVARAIRVLEQFREQTGSDDEDLLFVQRHMRHKNYAAFKQNINARLRKFIIHCNDVLAPGLEFDAPPATETKSHRDRSDSLEPIADGPDGPWHLTTAQFRKTLAWYIANRPMGLAAGMIQFGHASIQMYEGYAGHSASGFRQEVETESLLARIGDLCDLYEESREGIHVAGPMAPALEAEFDLISKQIGAVPGRVVDDAELRKLLRHRASKMRVGALADCFFEPSRARCLEHLEPDARHEPVGGLCDPRCPQACWTKRHISPWERVQEEAKGYAKLNRISPVQREILDRQAALAVKVLLEIKEARNGRKP